MTTYRVSNPVGTYCFVQATNEDDACRIACQLNLIPCHHWQDLTAVAS